MVNEFFFFFNPGHQLIKNNDIHVGARSRGMRIFVAVQKRHRVIFHSELLFKLRR